MTPYKHIPVEQRNLQMTALPRMHGNIGAEEILREILLKNPRRAERS